MKLNETFVVFQDENELLRISVAELSIVGPPKDKNGQPLPLSDNSLRTEEHVKICVCIKGGEATSVLCDRPANIEIRDFDKDESVGVPDTSEYPYEATENEIVY